MAEANRISAYSSRCSLKSRLPVLSRSERADYDPVQVDYSEGLYLPLRRICELRSLKIRSESPDLLPVRHYCPESTRLAGGYKGQMCLKDSCAGPAVLDVLGFAAPSLNNPNSDADANCNAEHGRVPMCALVY